MALSADQPIVYHEMFLLRNDSIETLQPDTDQVTSFLRTARSLDLDGPPDWAVNLDT